MPELIFYQPCLAPSYRYIYRMLSDADIFTFIFSIYCYTPSDVYIYPTRCQSKLRQFSFFVLYENCQWGYFKIVQKHTETENQIETCRMVFLCLQDFNFKENDGKLSVPLDCVSTSNPYILGLAFHSPLQK